MIGLRAVENFSSCDTIVDAKYFTIDSNICYHFGILISETMRSHDRISVVFPVNITHLEIRTIAHLHYLKNNPISNYIVFINLTLLHRSTFYVII